MASEALDRARSYLAERSTRERVFLLAGGALLTALLGYGLVYEPLDGAREKLAKRLPAERAQLRLMRAQVGEIRHLRMRLGDAARGGLEQRVRSSAAAFGLAGSLAQFVALADNEIQLNTAALPTNAWIGWLADLERHGMMVTRCRITSDQTGFAKLELTVTGNQR
ncbi:MAG: type II secretion system protein GspM [Thiobacillaceae bacterium]